MRRNSVYKGVGKTPQEAFESIWELMQFHDDVCLRQEDGNWVMRLVVQIPSDAERHDFEVLKNG